MDNIEIVNYIIESGFKETQLFLTTRPGTLICFGLSNYPGYKNHGTPRPIFTLTEISLNEEAVVIMTLMSVRDLNNSRLVITVLETNQTYWCQYKDVFYTKCLETVRM